jgi:hypothetical protein
MPTARHLLRAVGRPGPRLALFALLALAATWPLLATAPLLNEFRDAQVLSHYEQTAVDTILRYHQLPLWDPYYCGGLYLLGSPQARFASPTLLLSLLFGEHRGEALAAFAMLIVGLEGAFRYVRSRGASGFAAVLVAPLFALSGVFATAPSLGWVNFFSFQLLPWSALGVRRALRGDPWGVVIAAASLGWCVGFGGTYAAPMTALWCAFEVLDTLARRPWTAARTGKTVGWAAATAALMVGVAAFRIWPVLDSLRAAPRVIGGAPGTPLAGLLRFLFLEPSKDHADDGAFFIGMLAIPAIFLGTLRLRLARVTFMTYLSAWLAAGYAVHPSVFALLHGVPVYSTLRYPERYCVFVALGGAVLAARVLTRAEARIRSRVRSRRIWGRLVFAALGLTLAANVVPMVRIHHHNAAGRDMSPPPSDDDADRPFHQARGTRWALDYYEPMNRGSLSCWEAYPVPESPALRADLDQEAWLVEPGAGTLTARSWSPNSIGFDVHLARPARVAVNQNWNTSWRTSVGEVKSERGLLAVDLPPGDHAVTLRFLPRSAVGGFLVSLVAVLGLAAIIRRRGRRGVLAAAACAPLVCAVVIVGLVHEPAVHNEPVTDAGENVIVDHPVPEARSVDAHLEGGLTLEAVILSDPNPHAGEDLTLELDWRRDAQIEPGLGFLLHMEPSKGDAVTGDHVLLSSVLDLDDAPPGRTLRDVLPLHVPDDSQGKHWKVWVGAWRMRGTGERMRVKGKGTARVDADRLLAVEFDVR